MVANSFLGVFADSPLKPIERHINKVQSCAALLRPFFVAVFQQDWQTAEEKYQEILALEDRADEIKRELRLNLPGGLFMPVKRHDLLKLVRQQDKLANQSKRISGRILGRNMVIPAEIETTFMAFLDSCIELTELAKGVINQLDDLLETGFKGREVRAVEQMILGFDDAEEKMLSAEQELRKQLLPLEDQFSPVDAMYIYRTIESIGSLADISERIAARLELMLAD